MINKVKWIYPNTSELNRGGCRGGLAERDRLRKNLDFDLVEMPGDYVKNISEINRTDLALCSPFLVREAVADVYVNNASGPVRYSLHTEPALPRKVSGYPTKTAELGWFDQDWIEQFWLHVTGIVEFLGVIPKIIEIHPGYRPNTPKTIAQGVSSVIMRWREQYGQIPLFLLENRTGQIISTGDSLAQYWAEISKLPDEVADHMGIVLDFCQLYTSTKTRFAFELSAVPVEAVKGFHVHWKHLQPCMDNPLDWGEAFGMVRKVLIVNGEAYLLPEVMHSKAVGGTMEFCQSFLL